MVVYILMLVTDASIDYAWDYDKFEILGVYVNKSLAEKERNRIAEENGADMYDSWVDEDADELTHYLTIFEKELINKEE